MKTKAAFSLRYHSQINAFIYDNTLQTWLNLYSYSSVRGDDSASLLKWGVKNKVANKHPSFASPLHFGKMVRNYGFLVCVVVMAMDVAAGILGIQAEIAENKVHQSPK